MERNIEHGGKWPLETLIIKLDEDSIVLWISASLDHRTHQWSARMEAWNEGGGGYAKIPVNRREAEAFFGHQSCNHSPDCVPEPHFFRDFRYVD